MNISQNSLASQQDIPEAPQGWQQSLERYFSNVVLNGKATITDMKRLSGGAIQENWLLSVLVQGGDSAGENRWVLRTDSSSVVQVSMSRGHEYAVLKAVYEAGVQVPAPLWLCSDLGVIGREFFVMQAVYGTATGHRLVKDDSLVPDRSALCRELGRNLAKLHTIRPPRESLAFLPAPGADPARSIIEQYLDFLDELPQAFPVIEWGLRWLHTNKPNPIEPCLIHRDFRTGNFMVDQGSISGILDWEFTAWGDWREDIGWLTAKCWRFGNNANVAGGIGGVSDLMAGYSDICPREISPEELRYWQIMAHVRWAIIAVQQAERHLSGQQHSLELALTGRLVPELEHNILTLIGDY
ncbi:phosphotransferase family protein [Marinobacter psychrophilus]|uniref:phosphotransferase family protein n=1 Tax=Marinobacter psychrophilus TaxID=330734 RepID=UPI001B57718D|nr:phosphotransferase family protein [Marinobacter psychrophilus]MBQ0764693.1 phosphotransferase family protein [Marinobacter psychrophilus]MBQ0843361.1 phosphotransferase family protein [Marinobacter psychrophilus]